MESTKKKHLMGECARIALAAYFDTPSGLTASEAVSALVNGGSDDLYSFDPIGEFENSDLWRYAQDLFEAIYQEVFQAQQSQKDQIAADLKDQLSELKDLCESVSVAITELRQVLLSDAKCCGERDEFGECCGCFEKSLDSAGLEKMRSLYEIDKRVSSAKAKAVMLSGYTI